MTNLSDLFATIDSQYAEAMEAGNYERFEEKKIDPEWLKSFKEEGEKKRAAEAAAKAKAKQEH